MQKKITCSVDSVVELIRANIKDIVSVPIRSAVAFRIDKNTFVLEWYGDKYKPHELMISIKCGIVTEIELALSQTNKKLYITPEEDGEDVDLIAELLEIW